MEKKLIIVAVLCALIGTPFAAGGEKAETPEAIGREIKTAVENAAEAVVKTPEAKPAAQVTVKPEPAVKVVAKKAIPKPPAQIQPLTKDQTLQALSTMVKNFELNDKEMDKDTIIKTIKDFVDREQRKKVMLERHKLVYSTLLKQAEQKPEPVSEETTEEEKKKALARNRAAVEVTEVSLETEEEDIETLIEGIRRAAGVNMVLDNKAIAAGIAAGTVRSTVTLKVEGMALKNALNWITRLSGLVWTLKDEAIFITTPQNARNADLKLRIYDIRDQMAPIPDFPAPHVDFGFHDDPIINF
jgi:hypothetical protein